MKLTKILSAAFLLAGASANAICVEELKRGPALKLYLGKILNRRILEGQKAERKILDEEIIVNKSIDNNTTRVVKINSQIDNYTLLKLIGKFPADILAFPTNTSYVRKALEVNKKNAGYPIVYTVEYNIVKNRPWWCCGRITTDGKSLNNEKLNMWAEDNSLLKIKITYTINNGKKDNSKQDVQKINLYEELANKEALMQKLQHKPWPSEQSNEGDPLNHDKDK